MDKSDYNQREIKMIKKIQVYFTEEQLSTIDSYANAKGMNRGQAIRFLTLDGIESYKQKHFNNQSETISNW